MGKRKRRSDQNTTPPPPDIMPYSSRMDSQSKEQKSSHSVDSTSTIRSLASIMDVIDSSGKLPNIQHQNQNQNLSHSLLLRQPRHFYGRQYSRRNSANNAGASSQGKGAPRDERLPFKFGSQRNSDFGHHTENKDKPFYKPERIRSGFSGANTVSTTVKMECGICQRLLKRKPFIIDDTISSGDVSVVAVLVCGHVYHADCLEQRTSHEEKRDPPCPLCVGLLSQIEASRGLE